MNLHRIRQLIALEIQLEWRNRQALAALMIYSLSSLFISYLVFRQQLNTETWVALFWIIQVFAAVNAVARGFLQESRGLQLYYYTLTDPRSLILSRAVYYSLLLIALGILNFLGFTLFFGWPGRESLVFLAGLLAGNIGLASILSLVSGMVSRAGGNAALVAILAFPLLYPVLVILVRISLASAVEFNRFEFLEQVGLLLSLDLLSLSLAYLLFPYLWGD